MKLDWVILAEGLGTDAKDAVTLIGINQNVLVTPVLPVPTKRVVVVHLSLDPEDFSPGASARIHIQAIAPSGNVIAALGGGGAMTPGPFQGVPHSLDIPAQIGLMVTEYGPHTLRVEITGSRGDSARADVALYVLPPSAVSSQAAIGPAAQAAPVPTMPGTPAS